MKSSGIKISIGIQGFINFYVKPNPNYTPSELRDKIINALKQAHNLDEYVKKNLLTDIYVKPEISYVHMSEGADKYFELDSIIDNILKRSN